MTRSGWMGTAKALAVTAAMMGGLTSYVSVARADYSYTFTFTPTAGTATITNGSFTTSEIVNTTSFIPVSFGSYTFSYNGGTYTGSFAPNSSFFNTGMINLAGFGLNPSNGFSGNGPITAADNSGFKGTFTAAQSATPAAGPFSLSGTGIFQALLGSSSGGGGGGGGGGGASGGAPTPEINAGLGLILAGASFAFLRRRRTSRGEASAA